MWCAAFSFAEVQAAALAKEALNRKRRMVAMGLTPWT